MLALGGSRRHHFPGVIVGDRHHAAPASAEQPVVGRVDRHLARLLARRGRPAPHQCRGLRVDCSTSLESYTLPSPADALYSGLPPGGTFVISSGRSPSRSAVPVEGEHEVRHAVAGRSRKQGCAGNLGTSGAQAESIMKEHMKTYGSLLLWDCSRPRFCGAVAP